jgi:hypothetical protein
MKLAISVGVGVATLAFSARADAAGPVLGTVIAHHRHASATFTAPGADDATIYFATRPDRATDGRFLDENVAHLDFLTTDEIQAGRWLDDSQLDPGEYYVMLTATDFDCFGAPGCLDGFSAVRPLTVRKPHQRYRATVRSYRYVSTVDLRLRVRPLGETLPYRVCWTRRHTRRRCVRGEVEGYSWNAAASDVLEVRKRHMRRRTTFSWYVKGRKVASKRVRIRR